ncbi:MAG: Hpt domain-containing protein [Gammaproteobacteria bacterium]|nr:Hpt domain-containing protein [Gammaproteobacteria bacterium]
MGERIVVHIDPDLEELIPGFLANRGKDVGAMREALARDDFDRIRISGHSMKGAGGGYGFDAITEIGARIEQAAIARDASAVSSGVDALVDYLGRIDVVYDGES